MASSDNEEEISSKKLNQVKYSKLLSDGSMDSSRLQHEDYVFVKRFIYHAFSESTQVQTELEQTLRRTFVMGRGNQKVERSLNLKSPKVTISKANRKLIKQKRSCTKSMTQKLPRCLPYKDFVEVHSLWNAYVAELCRSETDPTEIQAKLNKMDLHGAHLKVVKSNCCSYEDLQGIVVKETKNTFVIVTTENILKTIPKSETTFDVKLIQPDGCLRIAGNSFLTRPAERVCKKMKSFMDFVGLKTYKLHLKYSKLTH